MNVADIQPHNAHLTDVQRIVLRGKTDAVLRQGGFHLGLRAVLPEECAEELARRQRAREYESQRSHREAEMARRFSARSGVSGPWDDMPH